MMLSPMFSLSLHKHGDRIAMIISIRSITRPGGLQGKCLGQKTHGTPLPHPLEKVGEQMHVSGTST